MTAQQNWTDSEYKYDYITYPEGGYLDARGKMYQDAEGALWIPRFDRLVRYDGRSLIDYPLKEIASSSVENIELSVQLTDELILLLSEEASVDIWSTSELEIVEHITIDDSIKTLLDEVYHPDETGSIFPMSVVRSTGSDTIYALLRSINQDKFYLLYSQNFEPFSILKSFDASQAMDMEVSAEAIYLSLAGQLLVYDHEMTLIDKQYIQGENGKEAYHIELDETGHLWIYDNCRLGNCGIYNYNFNLRQISAVDLPHSIQADPITQLEVIDNQLWIMGISKAYVYNLETKDIQELFEEIETYLSSLDAPPTISHFTGISQSSDGNIWLSSGYGIVKLSQTSASYSLEMRSDSRFCPSFCSMRGMTQDDQGNLYISFYSGIVKKDHRTGNLSEVIVNTTPEVNNAYSLNYYNNHLYWNDVKINLQNGEAKTLIADKDNGHVTNLVDNTGHIWMATCYQQQELIELYNYNPRTEEIIKINLPISLRQGGQMTGLALSQDGSKLWIATARTGAYVIDIADYNVSAISSSPRELYSITQGYDDIVWMGGNNQLVSYNPQTQETASYSKEVYNREGTLIASSFYSLIEDDHHHIWCGTSNGLLKFDTDALSFKSFEGHGDIGTIEFNRESTLAKDNNLYLGTVNGLYAFDPAKLSIDLPATTRYPMSIISAQKYAGDNDDIVRIKLESTGTKHINLAHDDNLLSVNYSMPFYSSFQDVVYSHRLEGFNDTWSTPSETGQVVYTNLLAGDYNLYMRGTISNSAQAAQEMMISIHVNEAWYRTIWFYLLLIALIAGGFYGLFRYRLSQILKLQRLRTKISQDLHDDVGSILTGVAMQSELLEMAVDEHHKKTTNNIATKSRYAISQMRDIVWAMDASKDSIKNLIDRMRDHTDDILGGRGIDYKFEEKIYNDNKLLSPNIRQAVYLIYKESITNIAKHSDGNRIDIKLEASPKFIQLSIQDNGSEKADIKTSGQGLTSLNNRALSINGTYHFRYENQGYLTTLKAPLKIS